MPSTNTLIEDNRRVLMISVNGRVRVNPEVCKHENRKVVKPGYFYTFAGEAVDNTECYEQCLDCGAVLRDDGTWGMTLKADDDKEIPF